MTKAAITRLATNLALSAVSLSSFLLVAEGASRWLERGRPDPLGEKLALWEKEWSSDYYILESSSIGWPPGEPVNRDGMPDRIHAPEKSQGVFRLAVLGDSVTAGTPFKPEESIPSMLREQLERRGPWTEVISVALWGWSTRQQRLAWDRIARRYRPDQAVVMVCLNDLEELQNNLSRPPGWLGLLHRRSALVRRLVNAEARSIRDVEELLRDSEKTRAALERFFSELRLLRDAVRRDGVPLAAALLPMRTQAAGETPSRLPQERIGSFCAREGIPLLDLLPVLRDVGPGGFEDIVHLSLVGRSRVAEALARADWMPERALGLRSLVASQDRQRGSERLSGLTAALRHPAFEVRTEAAWALAQGRGEALTAVPSLLPLLRDQHESVRREAAGALGAIGGRGSGVAIAELLRALHDPRQSVRWRAIEAVWRLGPEAESALPALIRALSHVDPYVRAGAAWCLHDLGPSARAALPALRALSRDADSGVRIVAVRALGEVSRGDRDSITALVQVVTDAGGGEARWKAARTLGRIGAAAAPAAPALVSALGEDDGHLRRESATALGRIRAADATVVPALARASNDAHPSVRLACAVALGRVGSPEVEAPLRRLLQDPEADVRAAARNALGKLNRRRTLTPAERR